MANIHIILQGKGGIGKTLISSYMCQVYKHFGHDTYAFDTDPVNATLASYTELQATRLPLLTYDGVINRLNFDELIEILAHISENGHVVIDSGSSSFLSFCLYMKEVNVIETLESYGHTVFLHTIIVGGQSIEDTVDGFTELASNFTGTNLVVWLNPFFGVIEKDGKFFYDFQCYKDYEHCIYATIELPRGNRELIGKDLEDLFSQKQTFETALIESKHIAVRSRLKRYWNQILSLIKEAELC